MEKKEVHVGKMETQLKQWGAKLDEIAAKAEEAGAEAKGDFYRRINDLKSKHQAALAKLDELKTASNAKWKILKTGVESACNEIEAAFNKLKI